MIADSTLGGERLTSPIAAIIFVSLFLEGVTILQVNALLNWRVIFAGASVPPVSVKIASTSWRGARYDVCDAS